MYDVVIIGAGVSGSAVAMELSKYKLKVLVVDKASDICEGTSKANSGIVHGGYDAIPGSLKAKLNIRGSEMMEKLSKRLDFPYKNNGSLVLCFEEQGLSMLKKLLEQGVTNGVKDIRIIDQNELRQLEPEVSDEAIAALYVPTGGIVCPFNLNIAMAENACVNGVEFRLNTEIKRIEKTDSGYLLLTNSDTIVTRTVINAAGVYADYFHNMVSDNKIHITPRRGEYCLMDKKVGSLVSHTLFQLPTRLGKGVLVTPTVHGNLLVGPNAENLEDREAVNTTGTGLDDILKRGALSVKELPMRQTITSFAGLRAHEDGGDFIIKELEDAKGFIDVAGIESPGLTCAPAIGEYVAQIVEGILRPDKKDNYISTREGIAHINELSIEERASLIKENPAYGNVICRCELVTEGEIVDSIKRPLGATTLDGVKRRTRAGMGRCQAGFCSPKTVDILARELGVPKETISKCGPGSEIIVENTKEAL